MSINFIKKNKLTITLLIVLFIFLNVAAFSAHAQERNNYVNETRTVRIAGERVDLIGYAGTTGLEDFDNLEQGELFVRPGDPTTIYRVGNDATYSGYVVNEAKTVAGQDVVVATINGQSVEVVQKTPGDNSSFYRRTDGPDTNLYYTIEEYEQNSEWENGNSYIATSFQNADGTVTQQTIEGEAAEQREYDKSNIDCGRFDITCHIANISYHVVMVPSASFLSLSGKVFDSVVNLTIVDMKSIIDPEGESIVDIGWTIVRDLMNMLFIFVLLYISLNTIINGYSATGKQIATVIGVALLINFSLFFTKIVIDFSNTLALSFYTEISSLEPEIESQINSTGVARVLGQENSVAGIIIANTGITTAFSAGDSSNANTLFTKGIDFSFIIRQAIFGALMMFIVAVVLFVASFMLLGRFIALIFILILSSAAFGAYMLPQLKSKITDKWTKALIGQAFFAPIFFLLLYISILFLIRTRQFMAPTRGKFENFLSIEAGAFISYVLVLGVVISSIIIAKQVSDSSGAIGKSITGKMGAAALGTVAMANRRTIGAAAQRVSESRFAKGNNVFSQGIRAASNRAATSTMDLRNVAGGEKAGFGKAGGKGGYRKTQADAVKKFESDLKDVSAPTRGQIKNSAKYSQIIEEESKKPTSLIHNVGSSEAKVKDLEKKIKEEKNTFARRNLTRQLSTAKADVRSAQAAFVQSLGSEQAKVVSQQQSNKEKSKKRGNNYMKRGIMDIHKMTPTYARFRDNQRSQKLKEKGQNDDLIAAIKSGQNNP
jgi:hypothetical protein